MNKIILLLLLFLDQILKYIFTTHKNMGVAHSIKIRNPLLMQTISLLFIYYFNFSSITIIGGISNIIDRAVFGYIRDHLTLYPINKKIKYNYIYNLADVYITIGCIEYLLRKTVFNYLSFYLL